MDKVNLFFSAVAVVFGILTLTKALSYETTMPIMNLCLGIACISRGVTEIRAKKTGSACIDFLLGVLFLYVTAKAYLNLVS